MSQLTKRTDRFRRAADIEAETPITAGPVIERRWSVKRAAYLSAIPQGLGDIIKEVFGIESTRYCNNGDRMRTAQVGPTFEYDTKAGAIAAAKELYRKDVENATLRKQQDEKAEAGLRILEAA